MNNEQKSSSDPKSTRLGTMVFTIANELVNHYGKNLDREVIDEITRNLTLEMCQGPTAWAFSGKDQRAAAKPQGEPVAMNREQFEAWVLGREQPTYGWLDKHWLARGDNPETYADPYVQGLWVASQSLYAEQPAPVPVVPDGYCIMPRQLTAENGAKALLLGEFKLQVTKECPECCELEEPAEGCSICDGEGEYGQKHTIPWDQIKFIYSKAVSGLALKAESEKSR